MFLNIFYNLDGTPLLSLLSRRAACSVLFSIAMALHRLSRWRHRLSLPIDVASGAAAAARPFSSLESYSTQILLRGRWLGSSQRGSLPGHDFYPQYSSGSPTLCRQRRHVSNIFRERLTDSQRGGKPRRVDSRRNIPRMRDCQTIEEAIQAIHDILEENKEDKISSHDISAFWNAVCRFLLKNQVRGEEQQQQSQQPVAHLEAIFNMTVDRIGMFGHRDLASTALAFAKIVNLLGKNKRNHIRGSSYHELLRGILADRKESVFQDIATVSMPILSKLDGEDATRLAYAYELIEYMPTFDDGRTFFDHLAENSIPLLIRFNPLQLTCILWSYKKAGALNYPLFEAVADHIVGLKQLDDFAIQELSSILVTLANAKISHPPLFEKVANHIIELKHPVAFKPQHLANIALAYTKAGVSHPALFDKVAEHIVGLKHLNAFIPRNLACILAYSEAEIHHPALFNKVANHMVALLDNQVAVKPDDVSNIVWTFAKVGISHPRLFEAVADHVVGLDQLDHFNPHALDKIIRAYTRAEIPHPGLFEKVGDHVVALEQINFPPSIIFGFVWSFAKVGMSHPPLFEKIADHIVALDNLDEFYPLALTNTVRAFARAGVSHPLLFEKVADHIVALDHLNDFFPPNFSDLLWAFTAADISHPQLFEKVANHIVTLANLEAFRPSNINNLLYTYLKAEETHLRLFEKCAYHIVSLDKLDKFKPAVISSLVFVFATAEISHPELFEKFTDHIVALANLDDFTPQAISTMAMAFDKVDVNNPQLCGKFSAAAIERQDEFSVGQLENLYRLLSKDSGC